MKNILILTLLAFGIVSCLNSNRTEGNQRLTEEQKNEEKGQLTKEQRQAKVKELENQFADKYSSESTSKEETSSGNKEYDEIIANNELWGKWIIQLSFAGSSDSYPYEIYRKGNIYTGVCFPDGVFTVEKLIKQGTRFRVLNDRHGEYYMVDGNMQMTLFDKYGELASSGWTATKQ